MGSVTMLFISPARRTQNVGILTDHMHVTVMTVLLPVLILPERLSVTTLMSVREKFPAQKTLLAEITSVHGAALVILVMKMTLIAKSAYLLLTVGLQSIPVMVISKSARNWTVLIFSNAFVSKVTSMTLMVNV